MPALSEYSSSIASTKVMNTSHGDTSAPIASPPECRQHEPDRYYDNVEHHVLLGPQ